MCDIYQHPSSPVTFDPVVGSRRDYPQTPETIAAAKRAADEERARVAEFLAGIGAFDVIATLGLTSYVKPTPEAS